MSETIKILFLASNPDDTVRLRLDEEVRRIDQVLRLASYRDRFVIKNHGAVRISDLQELLLRHQPHIVHFSGHGSQQGEIILTNEVGNSVTVPPSALSNLFKIWKKNIRCVVLNACYSETQAQAIAEHIDCVVGMSKAISDEPSICFSSAFYQALGYDKSLKDAFDSGCLEIALHGLQGEDIPEINGNKEKLANTYLLSEIRQAALENQLNKILSSFHSIQCKQTAQLCKLILESNSEHAEANLVAATLCVYNE